MAFERGANGVARRKQSILSNMLRSVSALALGALAVGGPAYAQDAQDQNAQESNTEDEIVVTGIRGSLRSSQEIKRDADVFVDSITAEDIGALPDRSVSEALQRVPGVAIDRFAAGVDPDHFSTEGSGVVIRGLNFVRSELNGRDSFTANNGRALSFADVPPELMSGVDVFKSPSADMIEGGLSGTVNLRTRVPFDSAGRVIAGSLEYSYGDFVEEWAPTYSVLYSDRWDSRIGEFGLLLNYVDSELFSRSDGTQASNFACRTNLGGGPANCNGSPGVWFPRGAAFRTQRNERERIGQAAAAQWESPDDTLLATFQYLRSESNLAWTEHAMEIATDNVTSNGDSRPVAGTSFTFDGQGIFTDGTITGSQGWRDDQFQAAPRVPLFGLQSNNIRRDQRQELVTEDASFNLRWTPTENFRVTFDWQRVDSTVTNLDVTIWGSTFQNLDMHLNGDDPPEFTFLPPSNDGTVVDCTATPGQFCPLYFNPPHADFSDPFNSFWRSAMDHAEDSEGEEEAFRIDVEYEPVDAGWLQSIHMGARSAERDQTTRFTQYNWGVLSEIWGGGGPVWFDEPVNGVPGNNGGDPSSLQTELFGWDNFFRGDVPFPLSAPVPFYAFNVVDNYDAFSDFGLLIGDEWRSRIGTAQCRDPGSPLGPLAPQNWVPLHLRCDVTADSPGGRYRLNEINPQHEDVEAIYLMVDFGNEDRTIGGNFGLRFVTLDRVASGYLAFPIGNFSTDAQCDATFALFLLGPDGLPATGDEPDPSTFIPTPFCGLDPTVRQQARDWANGALVPNDVSTSFDYVLPSFNIKWEFAEDMLLRFSASRSISYPEVGLTRNYFNLALDANNAQSIDNGIPDGTTVVGNPALAPIESTNFDMSVEWYFADVGQLTFAVFYKELNNVIVNGTNRIPFTNNGATFDVLITQPVNAEESGIVRGFEIAYQQTFDFLPGPFDGLGVQANYTYIDAGGVPQDTLSSTDPDVGAGRVANVDTSTLPLQGLSEHNFNFVAFYEQGPLEARLAWNWRSEFLLTTRDVIVPFAPIMNEDTGQLDGSVFYRINDNFRVGVQGVNLLNEITQTSQVLNNDGLRTGRSWFMNDRRFTFVARATF